MKVLLIKSLQSVGDWYKVDSCKRQDTELAKQSQLKSRQQDKTIVKFHQAANDYAVAYIDLSN